MQLKFAGRYCEIVEISPSLSFYNDIGHLRVSEASWDTSKVLAEEG